MNVTQVATLVNTATKETLGLEAIQTDDLTNIIDVGTALFNANALDKWVGALVNQVGRMVFVDRVYRGSAPSVMMDGWEYGSVVEKISFELAEATENDTWDLTDGETYNQDVFTQPKVSVKFFNSKTTFEIPISIAERQAKQSFQNATQMNAFVSGLYNAIKRSLQVKNDSLVMRTINNFIGETLHADYPSAEYSTKSGVKAINLLYNYNVGRIDSLTVENAMKDKDFLRYCAYQLQLHVDRLSSLSTLFNIGAKDRFTPREMLKIVALSEFYAGASVYLQSDTFHNELVKFPEAETVPFWQASGTDYIFDSTSAINIKTSAGNSIEAGGILAVMFDKDALGVTNKNERVTTHYNAKGEFWNDWFKCDAGYFNDFNENFIVFFIA